jgi:hypothetical protein
MSQQMAQLQEATIKAHCKMLRMPMVASQFGSLAEQAIREKQTHIGYLERYWPPSSKSASATRSSGAFEKLICRA